MAIRTSEQRRKRHEKSSAKGSSEALTRVDPDLRVHKVLARLPSHYRVVLEAKYLRGLSMKEIAADSGANRGGVIMQNTELVVTATLSFTSGCFHISTESSYPGSAGMSVLVCGQSINSQSF